MSLSVPLAIAVGWFTLPHGVTRRGEAPLLLLIIRGGCYPAGFSSPFRPRATHLATTPGAAQPPVTQTYRRLIRLVGPQKLYPITFLHGVRVIHPTLPSKNFRLVFATDVIFFHVLFFDWNCFRWFFIDFVSFFFFFFFFRRTLASRVFSSRDWRTENWFADSRWRILERVQVRLGWSTWKVVGVGINRFYVEFRVSNNYYYFFLFSCNFSLLTF